MGAMQLSVGSEIDGRITVPTEGFECLAYEFFCFQARQAAFRLKHGDELKKAGRENPASGKDRFRLGAQRGILDQVEPKQGREDPKRIATKRLLGNRAKGSGMNRHPATDRS